MINDAGDVGRRRVLAGAAGTVLLAVGRAAAADPQPPVKPNEGKADPNGRFKGKVVLITGATSGIGKAAAYAFAREGGKVFFCGRREELGKANEKDVAGFGGEATYLRADVRKEEDVKALVAACVVKHGRLDVAFNNAEVDKPPATIADIDAAAFDDQLATNLRGVFLAMKYELPHLVRSKGAVVNMASIGGRHAFPRIFGYAASKAAVIHMTRCAAQEFGKDVRVNAVAPGAIDTDMLKRVQRDWKATADDLAAAYPAKRFGTPEEVAAVLWLASDAAAYVSGQIIGVDGGDMP